MIKKLTYFVVLFALFSCSSEDANDCFQNAGTTIQQTVFVSDFERILVNRDVELILTEAPDFSVIIETGENLLNDVQAVVIGNELQLTDNNTCNMVRDYGTTKIYVSAPNIKEIRNSSQFDVSSNGVLNYPELKLISENFNQTDAFTIGDFRMTVNTTNLIVTSNNLSSFHLTGTVDDATIGFYSGIGRFEGRDLIAQKVKIYHRGSNDIIVNPIQLLSGDLYGTGNLISVNTPPTLEVTQHYQGRLILE
ncbi:head GIN domain-containing protein [Bizionia echini]|uniref:head GIN domain-containing protein n=1 Tax=Bizionia echini TaxID=649333 RepID=UPI0030D9EE4B